MFKTKGGEGGVGGQRLFEQCSKKLQIWYMRAPLIVSKLQRSTDLCNSGEANFALGCIFLLRICPTGLVPSNGKECGFRQRPGRTKFYMTGEWGECKSNLRIVVSSPSSSVSPSFSTSSPVSLSPVTLVFERLH